jgi:hypothetical protein
VCEELRLIFWVVARINASAGRYSLTDWTTEEMNMTRTSPRVLRGSRLTGHVDLLSETGAPFTILGRALGRQQKRA